MKLHQDDSVSAVAQPLRRIPFSRRQKVTAKLKQLEELEVIEKVNVPTNWINLLVAVEKPNGDIRICLDMRQANRAILREKHSVPTLEETLQEISEEKVFGKLDLNMAIGDSQLKPPARSSRQLLTLARSHLVEEDRCITRRKSHGGYFSNTWHTLKCPL